MSDQRQGREDSGSQLLLPLYMYNLQVIDSWRGNYLYTKYSLQAEKLFEIQKLTLVLENI